MGCAKEKRLGGWFISLSPGFADASEDVVTQLSHLFQALSPGSAICEEAKRFPR